MKIPGVRKGQKYGFYISKMNTVFSIFQFQEIASFSKRSEFIKKMILLTSYSRRNALSYIKSKKSIFGKKPFKFHETFLFSHLTQGYPEKVKYYFWQYLGTEKNHQVIPQDPSGSNESPLVCSVLKVFVVLQK